MASDGPPETGYRAIARRIERTIGDGTPDDKLASERSPAQRFHFQRGTVRRALQLLGSRGLIYRRDRSGWYTTPASLDDILTGSPPLAELTAQLGRELRPRFSPPSDRRATRLQRAWSSLPDVVDNWMDGRSALRTFTC